MRPGELQQQRLGVDADSLGASILGGGGMAEINPATLQRAPIQKDPMLENPASAELMGGGTAPSAPARPQQAAAPMSEEDAFEQALMKSIPGLQKEHLEFGKNYLRSHRALQGLKSADKQRRAGLGQYFTQLSKADTARRSLESGLRSFKEFKDAYTEGVDPDGKIIYNQKGMEAQRRLSQLKTRAQAEQAALDNQHKILQRHGIDIGRDVDPMTLKLLMARGLGLDNELDDLLDDDPADSGMMP